MEIVLFAGFLGGTIRGLVGFLKHKYSYKDVPFSLPSFLSTVAISGVVGLITAFVVKDMGLNFLGAPQLSFAMGIVVGYAGGDFLENLWKIITRNPDLYSFKKQ